MPDLRLPIGFEEQAPLDVQRLEGRALGEERFRLAQEKYAGGHHCEMETREDACLCLRIEIHEAVAADEQVDARDRRVLDQVVAAEDDGAAELLVEDVPIPPGGRSTLEQGGGDVLRGVRSIDRVACLVERVFVHVRSIIFTRSRKASGPMASASSMAIE